MIIKIFLRLNSEQNINMATNYEFISGTDDKISLCPIPEFVGEVKCDCGNIATLILNDEIYKCNTCIKLLIPRSSKLIKADASSYPLTKKTIKDLKFEWSVNQEKWYTLWGSKIETNNWKDFLKHVKDMIVNKKDVELNADYDREFTKKMTIL